MGVQAIGFRRRVATAAAVAAVLAAAGCGGGSAPPEAGVPALSRGTVEVDGTSRGYRLFTPPTIDDDRPRPLVLALHGANNSPDSFAEASRLDEAAATSRFVVVYPEAERLLWNGGFCCTAGRGTSSADVRFLDALITEVAGIRSIDLTRVYAVGVSAGGIMAYRLACDLTGRIAGVAAVAASMQLDDCRPSRPVSVLAVHGTGDQLVPYEGGRVVGAATRPAPPTQAVARWWESFDRCPGPPETRTEGIVTTTTWTGCAEGTRLRLIVLDGGGHNWFAKDFGMPNGAIEATAAVVDFLGLTSR